MNAHLRQQWCKGGGSIDESFQNVTAVSRGNLSRVVSETPGTTPRGRTSGSREDSPVLSLARNVTDTSASTQSQSRLRECFEHYGISSAPQRPSQSSTAKGRAPASLARSAELPFLSPRPLPHRRQGGTSLTTSAAPSSLRSTVRTAHRSTTLHSTQAMTGSLSTPGLATQHPRLSSEPSHTRGPPSEPSASHHPRSHRQIPARDRDQWLSGLAGIASHTWLPLGFFALQPPGVGTQPPVGPRDDEDDEDDTRSAAAFLRLLCRYYAQGGVATLEDAGGERVEVAALRNGLWQVLFNATVYCIAALDARRRRCASSAYEVVRGSSGEEEEEECGGDGPGLATRVPVQLCWRTAPGRRKEGSSRGLGSAIHRQGSQARRRAASSDDEDAGLDEQWPYRLYGGRLLSPIDILDWCFVVRSMAEVGFRRDVFYTQTPAHASPHELLLALLWLTKQYQLIAVAEYVLLSRNYGFLLHTRAEGAPLPDPADAEGCRLLSSFPAATAWPPASYDEAETIAQRLSQVERIIGPEETRASAGSARGSTLARRILALRRLLTLSLNRLEHALLERAEQVEVLGLHSHLDAQLCLRDHHAVYERLVEGLEYLRGMEERVGRATRCLSSAGSLIAFAVRNWSESLVISEREVALTLAEDKATWLTTSPPRPSCTSFLSSESVGFREGDGKLLTSVLSKFRAGRTQELLKDSWTALQRQVRVGGRPDGSPECVEFICSAEAQAAQEAQVQANLRNRYSLQAALAGELSELQQQRRLHGSPDDTGMAVHSGTGVAGAVPLVPLHFTTTTASFLTGSRGMQYTNVGQPQPNATTSSELERHRLQELLMRLAERPELRDRRAQRAAECERALKELHAVYGLRIATLKGGTAAGTLGSER